MDGKPRRSALIRFVGDHVMDFTSAIYRDILEELRHHVDSEAADDNVYKIPFVLTCAASLEAVLNDHLVNASFQQFGALNYKILADAYLSMTFRGRLTAIVPLLTKGRFIIRTESKVYTALCKLIKLRNELVHPTSFFIKGISRFEENENKIIFNKQLKKHLNDRPLRTIHSRQCFDFLEAIDKLDDLFFFPLEKDELTENELIKEAS